MPKIKIVGILKNLTEHELIRCIIHQNTHIAKDAYIKQIGFFERMNKFSAIIETDSHTFENILTNGKLRINWAICSVYEHVSVMRCFKCCGYNHKAIHCKNESACGKCGEKGHETKNCESRSSKCINCISTNKKLNLKLNAEHTAYDKKCTVYQRKMEMQKKRIEYEA